MSWKSSKIMFLWRVKSFKLIVKTMVLKVWHVAHANWKGINKTLKLRPKSIPKSMKNRYTFHARKRDTQNINNHQQSDQTRMWKAIKSWKIHANKKIEKKREKARSGTLPGGARGHKRSKIEYKLTEENLIDRERAAKSNTPWAPSGPERIEVARGKRSASGPWREATK